MGTYRHALPKPSIHYQIIRILKDGPGLHRFSKRSAAISGAGIVALAGTIMTMPGRKTPAAENIDILENGQIVGLF